MLILNILALIAMIALIRRDGMKEAQERQDFRKHLDHIRIMFQHDRFKAGWHMLCGVKHWSIGCEELRQTTMLEE